MKKHSAIGAGIVAVLTVAGIGMYTFATFADPPQRPPAHQRPPASPPTGQAVPRTPSSPPSGQAVARPAPSGERPPVPRGGRPMPPIGIGHPPVIVVPGGVDFWYDWPYPAGYPWPPAYPIAVPDTVTGRVRLDVSPKDAEVYVDGYYAGVVDDFNGLFHALTLPAGPHLIEMRKAGCDALSVHVYVQPNQTMTFRATMETASAAAVGATEPVTASDVAVSLAAPGDLRFDVTPKDAQVYVDGYYVGIADDFEGRRQRLSLAPGVHHLVLSEAGYESVEADVTIQSAQSTTYRGLLTRAKPQS